MNNKFCGLPAEKQSKIINGAMKQFAIMGYRKTSTQDIAQECGISKALLFHYFGSKKGLFEYVYNYSYDTVIESLKGFEYKENEDLFEMIHRSNVIKLELFRSHPYLYKFLYRSYFETDADVQEIVSSRNTSQINETAPVVIEHMDKSLLRDGIPPEKALQIILWVSEGFLQNKLDENDYDTDKLLDDYNEWMGTLKLCLYKKDKPEV
jgi:TetR/AcrR family transcriptional regulator